MRTLSLIITSLALTACSVYQNEGRKYLEQNAHDMAGIKLAERLVGCAVPARDADWLAVDHEGEVDLYQRDTARGFELRVEPKTHEGQYACDFVFVSPEQRDGERDLAIAATLGGPR